MRRSFFWLLRAASILLAAVHGFAQTMTVDLATQKPGEPQTTSVAPGKGLHVQLLNMIPNRSYSISALLETKPIDPLDASVLTPRFAGPTDEGAECQSIHDALVAITATSVTEAAVPKLRSDLQTALDTTAGLSCTERAAGVLAVAGTNRTLDESYNISTGQQLVVGVTRNGDDNKPLTWTKVFDAGAAGEWHISYGFLFLPSGDKTYFSKSTSDSNGTPTGNYVITQQADRQKLDFAPSVVFGWYPGWSLGGGFDLALGAGLGFDLSAPVVSLGPLITYNENIALTAGGVFHQVDRLAGQYNVGQTVRENLSSDTLAAKTYALTYYAGVSYRFGSRPAGFGGATSGPAVNATPTQTPSPAPTPSPSTPAADTPPVSRVPSGSPTLAPGGAANAPSRAWTVMIYMNGKNSLEEFALANFHAMAGVGSSSEVAYVAELGRPKIHHTTADEGWSGVYRFYISKNKGPVPRYAVEAVGPDDAARDMGKASTLTDFVRWAKATYPAQHYMLIIWNHGQGYAMQAQALSAARTLKTGGPPVPLGGVRAVSSDDDTGSILFNSEVAGAISASFADKKLDILGFDACLMAMAETAYAMEPSTKMMVASEELEPGDGWQYGRWMQALVANPRVDGAQLGRSIVAAYKARYGNLYLTTLSLVDLDDFKAAAAALSVFANKLRSAGAGELDVLRRARGDLLSYGDWHTPPLKTSIDLIGLLARYEHLSTNPVLKKSAAGARAAISRHIVYNYASARSSGPPPSSYVSTGLAIYYPQDAGAYHDDPYHTGYQKANQDHPIAFVHDQTWADLLYVALGVQ